MNLRLPSGLLLNRFSAAFLPKLLAQNGLSITKEQARALVKELNRYRRRHRDWKLVEVQSVKGEYIQIKI